MCFRVFLPLVLFNPKFFRVFFPFSFFLTRFCGFSGRLSRFFFTLRNLYRPGFGRSEGLIVWYVCAFFLIFWLSIKTFVRFSCPPHFLTYFFLYCLPRPFVFLPDVFFPPPQVREKSPFSRQSSCPSLVVLWCLLWRRPLS